MPQLEPPEIFTLGLYAIMIALLVIALYGAEAWMRRLSAIVAIGVAALATVFIVALYDGRAYSWFAEPAPAVVVTGAVGPAKTGPGNGHASRTISD